MVAFKSILGTIAGYPITGADPWFFLGGGTPLRNDVTDGEVKKK